jgi:hypothetical protein
VADWVTISALATAGGTLALAAATFASVRGEDTIYLALALRNVGTGIAVLHGWHFCGRPSLRRP